LVGAEVTEIPGDGGVDEIDIGMDIDMLNFESISSCPNRLPSPKIL
jgi:hypothetical protein